MGPLSAAPLFLFNQPVHSVHYVHIVHSPFSRKACLQPPPLMYSVNLGNRLDLVKKYLDGVPPPFFFSKRLSFLPARAWRAPQNALHHTLPARVFERHTCIFAGGKNHRIKTTSPLIARTPFQRTATGRNCPLPRRRLVPLTTNSTPAIHPASPASWTLPSVSYLTIPSRFHPLTPIPALPPDKSTTITLIFTLFPIVIFRKLLRSITILIVHNMLY